MNKGKPENKETLELMAEVLDKKILDNPKYKGPYHIILKQLAIVRSKINEIEAKDG